MGILLNKAKNYIINGGMDHWQRGTSFAGAGTVYHADRWRYTKNGSMVHTVSRSTDVPTIAESNFNFSYSYRLNLTTFQSSLSAIQQVGLYQVIEGSIFAPIFDKTTTLSFWVKAALPGTYPVSLSNGTSTRSFVSTYVINTANTWEKKVIAIPGNSAGTWSFGSDAGIIVRWTISSGTDFHAPTLNEWVDGAFLSHSSCVNGVQSEATDFFITGIQLEESVEPSNFERAGGNAVEEFELCQRYYRVVEIMSNAYGAQFSNGSFFGDAVNFNPMRVVPQGTYQYITGNSYWVHTGLQSYSAVSSVGISIARTINTFRMSQVRQAGNNVPVNGGYYVWEPGFRVLLDAEL